MKIYNKTFRRALVPVMLLFVAFVWLFAGVPHIYAANPVGAEDGVYSVPLELDLSMGADNFSSKATLEKGTTEYGTYYYFTFGHSSGISDLTLDLGGKKAGSVSVRNGSWTYYTYTLGEANVQSRLSFSAHVNAMGSNVNFTVRLNLSSATRTGDYAYEGERPAEFVPVISTNAGSEYQMQQGSVFPIPSATATLGTEECVVTASVFYGTEEIAVSDNCFPLENVGEYRLIYKASSPSYKTSVGNDTFTEYVVTVTSSVGGSTLAKFTDENGVFPEGTAIMPGRITEGSTVYSQAAAKMKTVADNFEVFGVSFIAADGSEVTPADDVALYFQANATYDRTKVVVYHMDENGRLTKLKTEGYGRYVKVETDQTGTFIVCVPGVAFHMPMWGYALIVCGCGVLLLAAVVVTVVVIVRKKRARSRENQSQTAQ